MTRELPHDWEWVKATERCRAEVMFGRLRELAKRDADQRNQQLGKEVFLVGDVDGLRFSVSKKWDGFAKREGVLFGLQDDLRTISVSDIARQNEASYTAGLDADGVCRLRRGEESLDLWQVLKASLGPLFFS